MNWKISVFIILAILFVACQQSPTNDSEVSDDPVIAEARSYANPSLLIEAEELAELKIDETIKLIDFRKPADYSSGHIIGAINIWRPDIVDESYPYGGMVAPKSKIEQIFSEKGINSGDLLIMYDDKGACEAARLWWILQYYGYNNIKILNGGIDAWIAMKGVLSTDPSNHSNGTFQFNEEGNVASIITKEEVSIHAKTGASARHRF